MEWVVLCDCDSKDGMESQLNFRKHFIVAYTVLSKNMKGAKHQHNIH
jgi:hypothetical protein